MMFPLLQSLIVRSHCKLELWDDDDGIDNGAPPDLVLDNTVRSYRQIDIFSSVSFTVQYSFSSTFKLPSTLTLSNAFLPPGIFMRQFQHTGRNVNTKEWEYNKSLLFSDASARNLT